MTPPARFRMSRSALLPVVILALCVLPTALVSAWTLLLLLVPAAVAAWVLRAGVDVGEHGITARSLLGSRTVTWSELSGLRLGERGELWLVTTGATEVRLPVLRVRDLPGLAAASGGRLADPTARPADQ
ncbi:PH domain-containing protein [Blastococcus sp. MG754426]|uniref:PH domain-containing protein n=1 Tax=unclassified Blastococcus TaxID=2619396 RepID=UPI001EF06998|nr:MULTISPECIES: PH domain-containing protein [unclassified Blastococcus]MCF6505902.1 PH domain-containing protein [Blastococcus sp. MG754426]MCF6510711.1 PH domain-containing protein [Blastococcus sp. MG754427]MCF6735055.1 PH domain-containing protein [Blastococcus sp. KM273129]